MRNNGHCTRNPRIWWKTNGRMDPLDKLRTAQAVATRDAARADDLERQCSTKILPFHLQSAHHQRANMLAADLRQETGKDAERAR